jgi:DNA mismatch endonuclease (patch repair protein)
MVKIVNFAGNLSKWAILCYRRKDVALYNMPDVLTPDQRHRNMAAIHSTSTKPELRLRHALWQKGFRYRVNDKKLPGKPDIVLPKYRTVIFIHGCFWHGHNGCKYYIVPKTNTDFWTSKITRNQERDQEVWRQLEAKGWFVIVVWECELRKHRLEDTVENVASTIVRNRDTFHYLQFARKKAQALYREERRQHEEREAALKAEIFSSIRKPH